MNRSEMLLPEDGPRSLRLASSELGDPDAPPLLLLHGITCSGRYWMPRLRPLARQFRLLMPDLPGFGRSPKPATEYRPAFYCEALLGYLERLGLGDRPIPIIGHSLGALLGVELATRRPSRFSRLILLSTPSFSSPDAAHQGMLDGSGSYRRLLTVGSWRSDLIQLRRTGLSLAAKCVRMPLSVIADSRRFTFRSLASTLEHCLMHYRFDDALSRCPTSLTIRMIHGDRDQAAPLAAISRAPQAPPHPELHVIRGAGHHPLHTHTAACMPRIREFLAP